jgi:predicted transcriptional regulator
MTDLDGRHRVQGLVHRKAVTVHCEETIQKVAEVLVNDAIGVVLVAGIDGGVVGVISERDVVRCVADGADLDAVRADDIMTLDLVTVERRSEITDAAQLMLDADLRHLVVTDRGEPYGVASVRDVLAAYARGVA